MRRHAVLAAIFVCASSTFALAGPKAPLTAKHVDEKGDPKEGSEKAPAKMSWVACFINVREKKFKFGTHTLYFGPWLTDATDKRAEDGKKFAAQLFAEYPDAMAKEFPKYGYKKEGSEHGCLAGTHSGDSARFWSSRDLGGPHATRSKYTPSFAK